MGPRSGEGPSARAHISGKHVPVFKYENILEKMKICVAKKLHAFFPGGIDRLARVARCCCDDSLLLLHPLLLLLVHYLPHHLRQLLEPEPEHQQQRHARKRARSHYLDHEPLFASARFDSQPSSITSKTSLRKQKQLSPFPRGAEKRYDNRWYSC